MKFLLYYNKNNNQWLSFARSSKDTILLIIRIFVWTEQAICLSTRESGMPQLIRRPSMMSSSIWEIFRCDIVRISQFRVYCRHTSQASDIPRNTTPSYCSARGKVIDCPALRISTMNLNHSTWIFATQRAMLFIALLFFFFHFILFSNPTFSFVYSNSLWNRIEWQ